MADQITKSRYSDEELEEFKVLISQKLEKAQEELTFYTSQIADMSGKGKIKGLDDGTPTANIEQLNNLAARQQKYIKHLENALIRIDNKVYGVCRESGNLISKARLKAVPHATLSISAKEGNKKR